MHDQRTKDRSARSKQRKAGTAIAAVAIAYATQVAASEELVIEGPNVFPESITSTADGTLITGSVGSGGIFKAGPGEPVATQWIAPGDNGLLDTFGVLADEVSDTLWVCSSRMAPPAEGATPEVPALYNYDLQTGTYRSKYPFPGEMGLCNDIAIGPDNAAYVADTAGGRVLRLQEGADALEVWSASEELGGADGLDFQGSQLFVNSFTTGKLLRIQVKDDGTADAPVVLETSEPFTQPDGLRRLNDTQFVMAQGSGEISLLTVDGDTVDVKSLRSGLTGPAGVTIVGDTLWALESKLSLRGQADTDPGPFKAYAISVGQD